MKLICKCLQNWGIKLYVSVRVWNLLGEWNKIHIQNKGNECSACCTGKLSSLNVCSLKILHGLAVSYFWFMVFFCPLCFPSASRAAVSGFALQQHNNTTIKMHLYNRNFEVLCRQINLPLFIYRSQSSLNMQMHYCPHFTEGGIDSEMKWLFGTEGLKLKLFLLSLGPIYYLLFQAASITNLKLPTKVSQ